MSARATSDFIVRAVLRKVHAEGGSATILAKGEEMSGAILVCVLERGKNPRFLERMPSLDGGSTLAPTGPSNLENEAEATAYWQRRRERDPDLWVVELDIAQAERFAAGIIAPG